jgi:hypothetical protein
VNCLASILGTHKKLVRRPIHPVRGEEELRGNWRQSLGRQLWWISVSAITVREEPEEPLWAAAFRRGQSPMFPVTLKPS